MPFNFSPLIFSTDCYGSDGSTTNVQDKDYQPSDSSSSDSDVDESQTAEQDDEQQTVVSKTKRKRNKKPDADNWQKNIPKIKRLKGEAHVSRRGKERGKVEMGESGCTSAFCFKSKKRGCSNFTQEDRSNIFNNFWDLPSWSVRQSTVTSLISIGEKKTVKNPNSKRGNPVEYFLKKKDGSKLQVCKEMFCSTLGIHKRTMSDWLSCKTEKSTVGGEVEGEEEEEKQKKPTKKMTDQEILYLKQWLLKVDCVDSHYCRSSESYKNKRFLEPGTKKVDLHERYCNDCKTDGIRPGCLTIFKKYFSDLGLSVFRPRKDQCDLCVGYHHRNVSKEQYDKHIQSKNRARTEKDEDKKLSLSLNDGIMSVWTFDTQSVILCPQTKASALYFRTKLQVHNFTLYNNCTRDGYCYFWDETQGELKAENFASLQFNHYKTFLTTNPNIKTLVLWSDGCLYQNKNSYLSNCYLQLALEQKIDIFQKYLTVGHTQMECDSMHSVIERNMVCDIYTPDDLRIVMQTARRNPSPYTVTPVKFLDFTKMSTTRFNSIRPGRKAGDSVVTQLSHLHYTPEGQIFYKVFHENEEWRSLPVRIANIAPENIKWDPLYTGRQKISKRKYDDLQYMKKVLPQKDHIFYDELEFYE